MCENMMKEENWKFVEKTEGKINENLDYEI